MNFTSLKLPVYASVVALFSFTASVSSADTVRVQGEAPGSFTYQVAAIFKRVIEDATDITFEVIPRGGSVANTASVSMGLADLGFANGLPVAWGANGLLEFEGNRQENNRIVFNGLVVAHQIAAASQAYVDRTGNDSVSAALGSENPVKMLVQPAGSINPVVLNVLLKGFDTDLETQLAAGHVMQVPQAQMSQRIRDGFAEGIFSLAAIGNPDVTEVSLARPMHFLTWTEADMEIMRSIGFASGTLPAESFNGQNEPYDVPIALNAMIANSSVSDDLVYEITKAVIENRSRLAEANQVFANWDPQKYIQEEFLVVPLHPGAERYYRELGWID